MNGPTAPTTHRPPKAAILAVPLVLALVLSLFAWPSARVEPRDLPIGVAGPRPHGGARSAAGRPGGGVRAEALPRRTAARAAIEDREVYGAFVASPSGPKVLTASAASPVVSQLLTNAAAASGAATEDVVAVVGTRWRWARRSFHC